MAVIKGIETGIPVKVLDEIRLFAVKYEIERVILFGSRARGDYHLRSDIDLAFEGGFGSGFIQKLTRIPRPLRHA